MLDNSDSDEFSEEGENSSPFVDATTRIVKTIFQAGCTFTVEQKDLLICCPSTQTAAALYHRFLKINAPALNILGAERITFVAEGKRIFSTSVRRKYKKKSLSDDSSLIISRTAELKPVVEEELLGELNLHPGVALLTRFSDAKFLYGNQRLQQVTSRKSNDWVGQDSSTWWKDKEELFKMKKALLSDLWLQNYRYVNQLDTSQLYQMRSDLRLVLYRGDLCRVLKLNELRSLE